MINNLKGRTEMIFGTGDIGFNAGNEHYGITVVRDEY